MNDQHDDARHLSELGAPQGTAMPEQPPLGPEERAELDESGGGDEGGEPEGQDVERGVVLTFALEVGWVDAGEPDARHDTKRREERHGYGQPPPSLPRVRLRGLAGASVWRRRPIEVAERRVVVEVGGSLVRAHVGSSE